ncbi:extracellular solute-binding protein [Glycomyces sp. NPDC047010]|uniref:sugar ABC transporter substrate-binding protein n=1 Tax=Glycomyces sp. NPDC047010 TaxID=3155023 RepID=UPI0033FDC718
MTKRTHWPLAAAAALALSAAAACSNGGTPEPGAEGNAEEGSTTAEIAFWDPYPQHAEGSAWDEHVKSCAPEGSAITRTSAPQTDLFNQLTTAVKEGTAPDVVLLDNPMMPEAVAAGMLATAEQSGIDTAGVDANLLGPGVVDGEAYGVPFGSNALGLYYNADLLAASGVDPASVTDWDSLNAALGQVADGGGKGITFSGVTGEEGVFQFLPWFWGAGADLADPASAEAVAAGQLLSDWIGEGYAPRSAATDNQSAAWDLFLTGEYAFAENGSWFAAAAAEADFEVGVIPIPAKDGGVAPVPTGGEFAVAPIQSEDASDHYANAAAVIACLTEGEAALQTNETLGYLSAKADVRAEQVAANPLWEPWVAAVEGAQGRTTDLGSDYVGVSASLSEAITASLNAEGDPAAVETAFQDAGGF